MNARPKLNRATVESRDDGHVVMYGYEVIAGPFRTQDEAWHWIDRNEVYEVWQKRTF